MNENNYFTDDFVKMWRNLFPHNLIKMDFISKLTCIYILYYLNMQQLHALTAFAFLTQVNFLECGGLALSLLISHKVADALSFFTFLNAWAASARGDPNIIDPCFNSSELFPPINLSGFQTSTGIVKDNISTRRFIFDAANIASIREQFADLNTVAATTDHPRRRPTRIEALSSFLWSRYMASTQPIDARGDKIYTVFHAVNLRTRTEPPMSERHFGNISRLAITVPTVDAGTDGGHKIVDQVMTLVGPPALCPYGRLVYKRDIRFSKTSL